MHGHFMFGANDVFVGQAIGTQKNSAAEARHFRATPAGVLKALYFLIRGKAIDWQRESMNRGKPPRATPPSFEKT